MFFQHFQYRLLPDIHNFGRILLIIETPLHPRRQFSRRKKEAVSGMTEAAFSRFFHEIFRGKCSHKRKDAFQSALCRF
ncbi:hypothetical protein HMPREF7215_0962 [Pyramidobacter piscolens W5455]|uniref:HTH araC/xylS-type domain-containing protein n=1 Tax=Pyramidobacter piscolens W5455 TaxID=352165 RepID=A0ABM9ZT49_9BACT|nr:hypothetical protein HMPREF7215_0962 [Pyramidobacter piscolens W5455]